MNKVLEVIGRAIARYLDQPSRGYEPLTTSDPALLRRTLRPCDVLLVEGNLRLSTTIKYLTQSTWSHAALFVGDALASSPGDPDPPALIEADLLHGVWAVPLSRYHRFHTRICRADGLTAADRDHIISAAVARIGDAYDLKNTIDLMRYLLPTPPVPVRWRRRMLALGSGEPTRAICSTLIAQLFQSVGYPILPRIETLPAPRPGCEHCVQEILHIRHHSLFAPRDFDISPYFEVVKPTIEAGFDYKSLVWESAGHDVPAKQAAAT
ncbi:MAG: lipo-like protein [Betaproteobacteria bacterium]|nr:lipo-like protein [Betaproteobacteria bacterium]